MIMEAPEKTEFNSNVATLKRIDSGLMLALKYRMEDNYSAWLKMLGFLLGEVGVKIRDQELLNKLVKEYEALEWALFKIQNSHGSRPSSLGTKIDNKLSKFEFTLRQLMNDRGMLLTEKEEKTGLR